MGATRDFNVAKMLLARHNRHKKITLPEVKGQPKALSMAKHHWTLFKKLNACPDFTSPATQEHFHHVFDAISLVEPLKETHPEAKKIFGYLHQMIKYFSGTKKDEFLLLLAKYQLAEQSKMQRAGAPIQLQLRSLKNAHASIQRCGLADEHINPIKNQVVAVNDHLADIFYDKNHKRYAMRYCGGSFFKAKAAINGALKGYAEQFIQTDRVSYHQKALLKLKAEVTASMLESDVSLSI